MFLQLAWRSIWRNPRRTAVILTAVVIGVWSMIFLSALMRGIEVGMVKNGIATLTGDILMHKTGYRTDPVVDHRIENPTEVTEALSSLLPADAVVVERVRVGAVASNARHTAGITLVGADPLKEPAASFIGRCMAAGRFLTPQDTHAVVVGKALLDRFDTKIGRKLVITALAADHEVVAKAFRVVGVFTAEMEATEKEFVFVPLSTAQKMLKTAAGVSEISVVLPDHALDDVQGERIALNLKRALAGKDYEILTWKEVLPLLSAYLDLFDGFIYIWGLVVFIAMGFGIVNTTLMAVFERIREFGLLKAIGMKPVRIVAGVLAESTFILVIGMAVGNSLGFISLLLLSGGGIDLSALAAGTEMVGMSRVIFPEIYLRDIIGINLVIFFLGLLVSIYPAVKAARITPVKAMAHN